jgi:hypothetical protein
LLKLRAEIRTAKANSTPGYQGIDSRQLADEAFGERICTNEGKAIHFI